MYADLTSPCGVIMEEPEGFHRTARQEIGRRWTNATGCPDQRQVRPVFRSFVYGRQACQRGGPAEGDDAAEIGREGKIAKRGTPAPAGAAGQGRKSWRPKE